MYKLIFLFLLLNLFVQPMFAIESMSTYAVVHCKYKHTEVIADKTGVLRQDVYVIKFSQLGKCALKQIQVQGLYYQHSHNSAEYRESYVDDKKTSLFINAVIKIDKAKYNVLDYYFSKELEIQNPKFSRISASDKTKSKILDYVMEYSTQKNILPLVLMKIKLLEQLSLKPSESGKINVLQAKVLGDMFTHKNDVYETDYLLRQTKRFLRDSGFKGQDHILTLYIKRLTNFQKIQLAAMRINFDHLTDLFIYVHAKPSQVAELKVSSQKQILELLKQLKTKLTKDDPSQKQSIQLLGRFVKLWEENMKVN